MARGRRFGALMCVVLACAMAAAPRPAAAAYVSTNPPVYNNANSADAASIGRISMYDATGNEIVSGSLSNLGGAVYVVASNAPRSSATAAQLLVAIPDSTIASTAWTTNALSAATIFPVTSGSGIPAVVSSATGPTVTLNGTSDGDLATVLKTAVLDSAAGYSGYLQLRVVDSGGGLSATTTWATTEIAVDASAGTWQQVFPVPSPASTSITAPSFSPASVPSGTQVRLTATVSPSNATGVVHFFDGSVDLGSAQYSAGTATLDATFTNTSSTGAAESHSLTAVYTATGLFQNSSSSAASLSVTYVKTATTTNLTLGASAVIQPNAVTATAAVTVSSASVSAGSVEFYIDPANPSAPSGAPTATVALSAGQAVYSIDSGTLTAGDGCSSSLPLHTVVAKYVGTGLYDASISSPAATFTVQTPSSNCSSSSNIQTSIPPGTIAITTNLTSNSPLTLPALTLNPAVDEYSSSVDLTNLQVSDSRPGNEPYTLSLIATDLTNTAVSIAGVNETISAQNLGIDVSSLVSTNASPNTFLGSQAPGVPTGSQNFTGFNNAPAAHVQSSDTGSAGLGGGITHPILHAAHGLGTTVIAATLRLTAPTNIVAGTYAGTITFSVVGS